MSDEEVMIDLDFTGVEAIAKPDFSPIPEGVYTLVLEDIVVKPSKSNPSNKVAHCTYTVSGTEYDGRRILGWQVVTPSTDEQKGYLKYWLTCLTGQEFDGSVSLNLKDLVGASVSAMITVEDRNDGKKDENGDVMKQNRLYYFINPLDE